MKQSMEKDWFLVALTSGFGLGFLPMAPGSFGALPGLAWHLAAWLAGWGALQTRLWCMAGVALFAALHYALAPWAQRHYGESDPHHYVLDEIPGYLMVPSLAVATDRLEYILLGFCLERVCDTIKLPVARYFDRRVHTPTGVLMDDIIAGIYAAAALSAALAFAK